MSAHPRPDEPKINNPAGLALRYQANVRLGADFYFPDEFSRLNARLARALKGGAEASLLKEAAAIFDQVERRYESRVSEVRGLLEGFLLNARHWLQGFEEAQSAVRALEQARCCLTFANPEAALRRARQTLGAVMADMRKDAAPLHIQSISSLTARALPLERLYAFLGNAPQNTTSHRYLSLLPRDAHQRFARWMGCDLADEDTAVLVRAVHDRRHVSYLVCLNGQGETWSEVVQHLPQWEGCFLHLEGYRGLAMEVAVVEHMQRLLPHVQGEFVLAEPLRTVLAPYPGLLEALSQHPVPVDSLTAQRFVHRMIEGHA